jgi:hypothetical protein
MPTLNPNPLNLARNSANLARNVYNSATAQQLRQQSQQQGVLAALVAYDQNLGKYEGLTIYGDRVWGDFYGIRAPRLGKYYAYSRAAGSDYGFFTDA